MAPLLRFVFLTGVSRFPGLDARAGSRVSIFSELNNVAEWQELRVT